jgi:hypothetical protein
MHQGFWMPQQLPTKPRLPSTTAEPFAPTPTSYLTTKHQPPPPFMLPPPPPARPHNPSCHKRSPTAAECHMVASSAEPRAPTHILLLSHFPSNTPPRATPPPPPPPTPPPHPTPTHSAPLLLRAPWLHYQPPPAAPLPPPPPQQQQQQQADPALVQRTPRLPGGPSPASLCA